MLVRNFTSLLDQVSDFSQNKFDSTKARDKLAAQAAALETEKKQVEGNRTAATSEIHDNFQQDVSNAMIKKNECMLEVTKLQAALESQQTEPKATKMEEDSDVSSQTATTNNNNNQFFDMSIAELKEKLTIAQDSLLQAKSKLDEITAQRDRAKQQAAQPFDDKIRKLKEKLDNIKTKKDALPDSPASETLLMTRALEALRKIPRDTQLSAKVGDQIVALFEVRPDLIETWCKSTLVIDSISRSSSMQSFYEKLLKDADPGKPGHLLALAKLTPFYNHDQAEIDFQQSMQQVSAAFQAMKAYADPERNSEIDNSTLTKVIKSIANFRSEDLGHQQAISNLNRDLSNVNGKTINFEERFKDYQLANGKVILYQIQFDRINKEYEDRHQGITEVSDDIFTELEQLDTRLFAARKELDAAKTAAASAKTELTDFIYRQFPKVVGAWNDAKISQNPDQVKLRSHHFFSSKKFSDSTPVALLKKLADSMEKAIGKVNYPDQNMNNEAETVSTSPSNSKRG